jgi:hypothetical protein
MYTAYLGLEGCGYALVCVLGPGALENAALDEVRLAGPRCQVCAKRLFAGPPVNAARVYITRGAGRLCRGARMMPVVTAQSQCWARGYRYYEGRRSVAPHTCRQRVFGGARHAQPTVMLVKVPPAQKHVATARRQPRLCQMLTHKDVWKQHTQDKHTGNTLRVAPCACFHSRPSRNASWG